jgi:sirohydrochlorin cobaltochelatase
MKKEGIIIIQHGDFPHDFMDKHREMFDFIKGMISEVSKITREIEREPNDCYLIDTKKIMRSVKRIGGYQYCELGYMEFSKPAIEEAVQKLEKQGVKRIVLVNTPGLMMKSSHSLIDVPRILREIKKGHPDLEMMYTPPGVVFDEMADVFIKRMDDALGKRVDNKKIPSGTFNEDWGVVLIAHGDVPFDYLQTSKKMEMTEKHIDIWSDMVRDWPRNEENDPLYFDTLELEKHIKEKVGYEIETGNLEFTSPSLQEALNKLTARGVEKIYFMGGTGFMDRSSHTLVDIPEALAKLKEDNPDLEIEYVYPNIDLVCDDLALMLVEKVNQALKNVEYVS